MDQEAYKNSFGPKSVSFQQNTFKSIDNKTKQIVSNKSKLTFVPVCAGDKAVVIDSDAS